MKVTIQEPPHGGTVAAIASKSHAHRALIAAALSDSQTHITCGEINEDIIATVRCLESLGAQISYTDSVFTVVPIAPVSQTSEHTLDVGESGSTLRFMLPVACALGVHTSFVMRGRLPQRPLSPLYEELIQHGCTLSPQGTSPLHTAGQLQSGDFHIAGNISSQFITGLLFALPLLRRQSTITVEGTLESRPYVDITLQVLADFGITIRETECGFIIPGNQQFASPKSIQVEGDWSNAACWFAIGALQSAPVTITGLNLNSAQGDKAFLSILKRFGAQVIEGSDQVTVTGSPLQGIDVDASATPDLVPMIAAVALAADGQTRIQNAARLRLKESDRLHTIAQTLSVFGAQISETEDGLMINGSHPLHGGTVSSAGDHRIAMMAASISSICNSPVEIQNAEAVNKSYPGFYRDIKLLGGAIQEVQG